MADLVADDLEFLYACLVTAGAGGNAVVAHLIPVSDRITFVGRGLQLVGVV